VKKERDTSTRKHKRGGGLARHTGEFGRLYKKITADPGWERNLEGWKRDLSKKLYHKMPVSLRGQAGSTDRGSADQAQRGRIGPGATKRV